MLLHQDGCRSPLGAVLPTYVALTYQITSDLFEQLAKSNVCGETSHFLC